MKSKTDDHRMRAKIGSGEGADIERLVGMVWVARVWGFDMIDGLVYDVGEFEGGEGREGREERWGVTMGGIRVYI